MTSWAEREQAADLTWQADRVAALTVPCPDCHAVTDEECLNLHTQQPLEHQAAHAKRIDLGREAL